MHVYTFSANEDMYVTTCWPCLPYRVRTKNQNPVEDTLVSEIKFLLKDPWYT